jgi:hypothetical protein
VIWHSKGIALRFLIMILLPMVVGCGDDAVAGGGSPRLAAAPAITGGGSDKHCRDFKRGRRCRAPTGGSDTPTTDGSDTPTTGGGDTPTTGGGGTPPTGGGDTPTTGGGDTPTTDGGDTPTTDGGDTPTTDGGDTPTTDGTDPIDPDTNTTPLAISGIPPSSVRPGQLYAFRPSVAGDGSAVTFSISNKPAWASFEPSTGELRGTPEAADIGITDNIVISGYDGISVAQLPAFSISVEAFPGTITLSWIAPFENVDGTQLTDLAGYRIYYGLEMGVYTEVIDVPDPTTLSYTIDNLPPNLYYVVATSYDVGNTESAYSNVIERRVN